MQGISDRLAGICLFSLSIVIVHQSGHAQTAAQNRIVQPIVAAQVSPLQGTVHPLARRNMITGPVASSMQLLLCSRRNKLLRLPATINGSLPRSLESNLA